MWEKQVWAAGDVSRMGWGQENPPGPLGGFRGPGGNSESHLPGKKLRGVVRHDYRQGRGMTQARMSLSDLGGLVLADPRAA